MCSARFDIFDTMTARQRYTQAQIIDALKETKGMVYLAAKRLGCEAQTIYNYRDRYPAVRAEMEQQDGEVDDAAEMKLYQAIIAGEPWAVQFRLRTKGKGRGYVERVEQDIRGKDGGPVQFQVFDHTAATAAIARRSGGNRNASGADEDNRDGA